MTANCQRVFWERGTRLSAVTSPDGMSQYPAQPYGVQVQQVPQYGYAQPGYGQPPGYDQAPHAQTMQTVVSVTPAKTRIVCA